MISRPASVDHASFDLPGLTGHPAPRSPRLSTSDRQGDTPVVASRRTTLAGALASALLAALVATMSPAALAQPSGAAPAATAGVTGAVTVDNAWVRATVSQQRSTGAFFGLTSPQRTRLVAVESPAADIVEVHEMALVDNIMRMRAVDAIPLEPDQRVALQPGGLHVMLIDLRKPVQVGDAIPLTLVFEDAQGKRTTQTITATARPLTTGSQDSQGGQDGHGAQGEHGGHGAHGDHGSHGGQGDHGSAGAAGQTRR